jgi:hypothetical protein
MKGEGVMGTCQRKIGVVTRNPQLVVLVQEFLQAQVLCTRPEKQRMDLNDLANMIGDVFGRDCKQLLIDCEDIQEITTLGWAYLTVIAEDGVDIMVINPNEALCQRAEVVRSYTKNRVIDRLRFFDGRIDTERLRHALAAL